MPTVQRTCCEAGIQGTSRKGSSSASPVCSGHKPHASIPYMGAALENTLLNGRESVPKSYNLSGGGGGGLILCRAINNYYHR